MIVVLITIATALVFFAGLACGYVMATTPPTGDGEGYSAGSDGGDAGC